VGDLFNAPHKTQFDVEYMRALFKIGYDQGVEGHPWQKTPPGHVASSGL
jgi:hypothetical protein